MTDNALWPFEVEQHITAMSKYYAGKIGSRFYITLRDEGKIMAVKCPRCGKVYMPPRETCGPCFYNMKVDDMVEVGPEGVVETFTQVHYNEPVIPREAPFVYAVIKLDGADTGITHYLGDVDYENISIGMKVTPVLENERQGNILDIKHFKPV